VKLPIPKSVERRLQPLKERGDEFLRTFEWTWTAAFIVGILVSFLAFLTLAVVPSWWLNFTNQTLRWSTNNRLLLTIRDLVALGWLSVWAGAFVITAYKVQVYRRKLRGERQAERYSGGYR
jgi:type II secretory pathway component PulF